MDPQINDVRFDDNGGMEYFDGHNRQDIPASDSAKSLAVSFSSSTPPPPAEFP